MEITRTPAADHLELKLKGRLDAIWSEHVGRALAECIQAGQHALALDMSEVDFISSAGIRILVIYARQLKAIHGQLFVTSASDNVRGVLQLAGLGMLLRTGATPGPAPGPAAEQSSGQFPLAEPGTSAEVYELDPRAGLQVQWPGDEAAWLAGHAPAAARTPFEFSEQVVGLGLGALGADGGTAGERLGEFLAAGGAAVCQPADGTNKPDYLLRRGSLTPTVQVAYGWAGRGNWRRLLRFDKGPEQTSVSLSVVVKACLEAVGGESVALAMVAETAALIGASLQQTPTQPPAEGTGSIFTFPHIRDWLSFTAEPAFTNTTSLVVGLAATAGRSACLRLLRPLVPSGRLLGHFHAAAFPYRPLRKGRIELAATVQTLFESEQVLGLLHLVHDWRPANGAGESRFLRGACWCAAVE